MTLLNKKNLLIAILLLTALVGYSQKSIKREIKKIIKYDTSLEYGDNNGFQVAIIDGDSSFVYHFGRLDKDNAHLFELGGATKVFTASLVNILANEGFFKLTDPINNYLPSSYNNPRLEDLRIIDLVEHTSGFLKKPNDFGSKELEIQNPYAHYTKLDLLKYYKNYLPKLDKTKKYIYSHTNYALLEIVIENATQESFETILTKKIFAPIGMNESYVTLSEHVQDIMTPGYDRAEEQVFPRTYNSFAASTGIKSSMADLQKFVYANINDPSFSINHISRLQSNYNNNIFGARGWHVLHNEAPFDIITTSGKTSGHHVMIAMIKETKTGVIVLNDTSKGSQHLAFLILRMINNNWNRTAFGKS